MRKVLIIGADGFVGKNLVNFFKEKRFKVYSCGLRINSDPYYFSVDLKFPDYNRIIQNLQPDICINASGSPGVFFSLNNPEADLLMNVLNPKLLIDAILEYSPATLYICLSSAAVYGNPKNLPIHENSIVSPISTYGINKLANERYVHFCMHEHGLKCFIVRIFSAFGIGLRKQLFWDIYQKSKENDIVTLFGTGNETRDFISIDQICEAIYHLILSNKTKGEIFNLASGMQTSIRDASQLFLKEINTTKKIQFNGLKKEGDPLNWCASIDNLLDTGFISNKDFTNELIHYARWVKENG